MFAIKRVELLNFGLYRGEHTFKFPKTPGLYSLTGVNNVNPRMGANECGKSTLLNAIYWCLYGRTTRGLKAGEVISWGESTAAVGLELNIAGQLHFIRREQSPNSLTCDGEVIDQESLQKLIRLSPGSFCYAVMLPQFGNRFFDLTAGEKLTLFSQIMGLDNWLEFSRLAQSNADSIYKKLESIKSSIQAAAAKLDSDQQDIDGLILNEKEFTNKQNQIVKALETNLLKVKKEVKELGEERKHAKTKMIDTEIESVDLATEIATLTLKWKGALEEARKLDLLESERNIEVGKFGISIDNFKRSEGGRCRICNQLVDMNHSENEKRSLRKAIKIKQAEIAEIKAKLEDMHVGMAMLDEELKNLKEKEVKIKDLKREIDWKIMNTDMKMGENKRRQLELQALIDKETNQENPYSKLINLRKAMITGGKKQIEERTAKLNSLTEEHTATEYWVGGFKRLRLYIIEETLQQLELEVNNSLASLGLTDWRIEFDIERENKAGGVTKGFVVLVYAPRAPGPVRLEAWSGGATQRLRLAGDLGLANLIMERAGLRNTIEFYDEPSAHMSAEGILDLAETLSQRALDTGRTIFLVDHHAIDFGDFVGRLTCLNGEEGAFIEYESLA